jgi:hypothetical protein
MEINTNLNTGGVSGPTPPTRAASPAKVAGDGNSFASSAALENALKSLPDSRPEVVVRGKALANDPSYPPAPLTKALSLFLARNLTSDQQ